MTEERRSHERVLINLPVKWSGFTGHYEARIEDLSLGGCFVTTIGRADVGEVVSLEIGLPSGEWLPLRGEVVSYEQGIGYGVLFSFLTNDEEQALKDLVA